MKEVKNDEQNIEENNNNKDEEVKENNLENNLPKELLELIEQRKDKEPFTAVEFEKYKVFKKLDFNFSKQKNILLFILIKLYLKSLYFIFHFFF